MRPLATDPAAVAVQDTTYRALAVLRVVVLLNALGLGWYRRDNLDHPTAGLLVFVALTVWTLVAVWAYASAARRTSLLLVADLLVALAAIGVSPWVKGPEMRATLPGFWVMGVVLAWAIGWRWRGGLVAGVVVAVADLGVRVHLDQGNYGNVFLLLVGGPVVGFLVGRLIDLTRERDTAQREVATAAERARLARAVHDGVLQVLALVQRRGAEIGGDAAELGRLAGEQEVALRALVQSRPERSDEVTADLADLLTALGGRPSPRVSVAVPGPVPMDTARAREVEAVVRACLHNVADHVGADASAWVLLEDLGDVVAVSVRDEGPGIAPGRLEQAAAQGRLGVSGSVRGRVSDLGGTAVLSTSPRGTEWELTVPKEAQE
ncbi:MacS family sensor histidine kinase [Nocardioides mangrovicus]|uniref:MacS family sensor histidine kinase n=1 Tax=Nocardioides mangrovicus TaxID=2478913 RepID=UPI001314337D|nr:DUF5931 domain-containing protein [Nocardioides mangrovicus]